MSINHIELSKLRKSVNKDIDSVKKCVSRYIVTFDCTKYLHLMQINAGAQPEFDDRGGRHLNFFLSIFFKKTKILT